MAFGINKDELICWKRKVINKEIAFLTHYWQDERFPNSYTVTKVGCQSIPKLVKWGRQYDLYEEWIHHHHMYPHFDLFGKRQKEILQKEGLHKHISKFGL